MTPDQALSILSGLFHLWLVSLCLTFGALALVDLWHTLTDPFDWSDAD